MPFRSDRAHLPLLITGISGVAGYNALYYFRARYPGQVVGLRQPDNQRLLGADIVACDATDRANLERLFREHRFRAVLNCAGNCALRACELNPAMAWQINVTGVETLLDVLDRHPARLVHLSIDLVYSGRGSGGHRESDPTDPVTVYGSTMVAAEERVTQRRPDAAILRISLPMGVSLNGHAGAIDWIQSRFRQLKPATLYFDEVRTPTYTDCLNELCEAVLARELSGLYHAGGPRCMTLYQIAQVVNRVGGYDPRLLIGCPRADAGPIPPRAGNVTMDCSRLSEALGYRPFAAWPLLESQVPTHLNWHFERPADEPRGPEAIANSLYAHPNRPDSARPPWRVHRRSHHSAGRAH